MRAGARNLLGCFDVHLCVNVSPGPFRPPGPSTLGWSFWPLLGTLAASAGIGATVLAHAALTALAAA